MKRWSTESMSNTALDLLFHASQKEEHPVIISITTILTESLIQWVDVIAQS